jgi:uncharacterized cofD-like protein
MVDVTPSSGPGPDLDVPARLAVIGGAAFLVALGLLLLLDVSGLLGRLPELPPVAYWLTGGLLLSLGLGGAWLALRRLRPTAEQATGQPTAQPVPRPDAGPAPLPAVADTQRMAVSSPPALPAGTGAGPKIVVIGGGTGMPQLLRGLRTYTDHITAVVTVADDGGSSGRLRRQMGMLPPGDFRNNIAALSEAEELMTRLFQYRFGGNDAEGIDELAGHSFGNLFITTMAAVSGSFEAGIAESSRVLAVRGRVLPSTLEHVTLCAEIARPLADGGEEWIVVEGESNIPKAGGRILRVFLKPDNPRAYPAVIQAILQADLIVAGPGSFFTSVMPNLLVPAVRDAICAAPAPSIYVCNVATQPGETDGFTVSDHMRHLRLHAGDAFTTVLANRVPENIVAPYPGGNWVALPRSGETADYRLFTGDLVDRDLPSHHDPAKVAARLMEVHATLRDSENSFTRR